MRSFGQYTPQIGSGVYIDPQAAVIGQVTLGDNASIWPCASIRGDLLPITIGTGSNVQDNAALHTTQQSDFNQDGYPLNIGHYVTIGHSATLHGCTIHDYALIGMGAVILDGATIESEVIVAAGSVVPPGKTLTPGLWMGNPARLARPLTQKEIDFIHWSPNKYIELKNQYLEEA